VLDDVVFDVPGERVTLDHLEIADVTVGWYAG
jgi:hypothetical protein